MPKYKFTVVTPSFNNAKFIHRVYESLAQQTFTDFEWIVVNDGSRDNTDEVVKPWIENQKFPTRYFSMKENKGKMTAMNFGVGKAEGELCVVADADDRLKHDCLERMLSVWNTYSKDEQQGLKGVVGLCEDQHGNLVGDRYPESPWVADVFELRFKADVKGEKFGFTRTDLMRAYPFETEVDTYVPESHVWFAMGLKYKEVCVNEIFRVFYVDQEGHTSISSKTLKLRFIRGARFNNLLCINEFFPKIPKFGFKVKTTLLYYRFSRHCKIGLGEIFANIRTTRNRLLLLAVLPLGMAITTKDRLQKRV